jgi:tRNA pseudouridine38-40 synthase
MNNYKLVIQYDGSNYAGWQMQNNAATIQEIITSAIETITKEKVILNGSGRTDSGVHALGQVANFRTGINLDMYKFRYQLNSLLPEDISIISGEKTLPEFHSRYDAKRRSYIYLLSGFKSPFFHNYSWYINKKHDLNKLKEVSKYFLGKNNFSAFSKKRSDTQNKICQVYDIAWRERNGLLIFYIAADRFLHGMVRTILGTIMDSVNQQDPESYIKNIFNSRDRSEAGESVPAKGLFLYKVKYDN